MSLRHAILGILDHREMHGYQLKRVLDEGISTFWPVNLPAIYPSLRKLEEEALVEGRREPSAEGRPDRKVYSITDAGRAELAAWRRLAPDGEPSVRDPLYLKLLFAREEDFPEALSWVDKQVDRAQAGLDQLRAEQADPRAFSSFFVKFLRESGAQHLELEIELLKELRARMQQRAARGRRRGEV